MNYERAMSAAKSTKHLRVAVLVAVTASMLATTAALLAAPRLSAVAGRDLITSMHDAWIRIAPPGMQFPAGRLTPRAAKIWIVGLSACYLPRLNFRFANMSGD